MAALEHVKVGGIEYAVEMVQRLYDYTRDGKISGLNGQILYHNAKIQLESENSLAVQQATACHEIVHAILEQAGYDDHNEGMVRALGYGLAQVIKDNPALVKWLRAEEDAESGN